MQKRTKIYLKNRKGSKGALLIIQSHMSAAQLDGIREAFNKWDGTGNRILHLPPDAKFQYIKL